MLRIRALQRLRDNVEIWAFAFGYFAAYVPYSAITKALTKLGPSPLSGPSVLPLSAIASLVAMTATLSALRWWKHATHHEIGGMRLPVPGPWTALSGVATATIILTTTFAYTIPGASIVLMMVAMRGGVLLIAPLIDLVSGRRVRWYSWVALGLSAAALSGTVLKGGGGGFPVAAMVDIGLYLLGYVVRLRAMSHFAKGAREDNLRFFVEEQMVATPAAVLGLAAVALLLPGEAASEVAAGFSLIATSHVWPWVILVGVLSQATGVFGGLILLDPRENSFCVPVNRASSMIAGVVASFVLAAVFGVAPAATDELVGAALMVLATVVLAVGPKLNLSPSRA